MRNNAAIVKVEHRQKKPDKRGEAQHFPETVYLRCLFAAKRRVVRTEGQDEVTADGQAAVPSRMSVLTGDRVTIEPLQPRLVGVAGPTGGTYAVVEVRWAWGEPTKMLYLQEVA